jgi:hypothetical protein
MANTFIQIGSTITVGAGGAATIDFTSIPSTYTDLVIKLSARDTSTPPDGDNILININGVTTNQSQRAILGLGSGTPTSYSDTRLYVKGATTSVQTASTFGSVDFYFTNYAGNTNKVLSIDGVGENNAAANAANFVGGLWSSTAAITSIQFVPNVGSFVQHSTATLYGIKNS